MARTKKGRRSSPKKRGGSATVAGILGGVGAFALGSSAGAAAQYLFSTRGLPPTYVEPTEQRVEVVEAPEEYVVPGLPPAAPPGPADDDIIKPSVPPDKFPPQPPKKDQYKTQTQTDFLNEPGIPPPFGPEPIVANETNVLHLPPTAPAKIPESKMQQFLAAAQKQGEAVANVVASIPDEGYTEKICPSATSTKEKLLTFFDSVDTCNARMKDVVETLNPSQNPGCEEEAKEKYDTVINQCESLRQYALKEQEPIIIGAPPVVENTNEELDRMLKELTEASNEKQQQKEPNKEPITDTDLNKLIEQQLELKGGGRYNNRKSRKSRKRSRRSRRRR